MPELKLDPSPPHAVLHTPLPAGAKLYWTLRAVYPAPYGTVWVRYSENARDEHRYLEVLTGTGILLQRVRLDPSLGLGPPLAAEARYLEPTRRRGPLLYLRSSSYHHFYVFPDGFSGLFSENNAPISQSKTVRYVLDSRGQISLLLGKERYRWSGVSFMGDVASPSIVSGSAPRRLPLSPTKEKTRFAAVAFDQVYFLRWVTKGEKAVLEVLERSGRRLMRYSLPDTFGASGRETSLSAVWVDERRKRTPAVIVKDSDQVRVLVFSDDLRTLFTAQDFSDFSSSMASTTVSITRDKRGLLTVIESYSESPEETGKGINGHNTIYHWTGKSFDRGTRIKTKD